jgi:hypothetical protein
MGCLRTVLLFQLVRHCMVQYYMVYRLAPVTILLRVALSSREIDESSALGYLSSYTVLRFAEKLDPRAHPSTHPCASLPTPIAWDPTRYSESSSGLAGLEEGAPLSALTVSEFSRRFDQELFRGRTSLVCGPISTKSPRLQTTEGSERFATRTSRHIPTRPLPLLL